MLHRSSGILLPVSALPGKYGIGGFGTEAYQFVDFLAKAKQSWWQVLPLGPSDPAYFYSPYSLFSAIALNPLFIDTGEKIKTAKINYTEVSAAKEKKLREAFRKFRPDQAYDKFCDQAWLNDYALFMSLNNFFKIPWPQWPKDIAARMPEALAYWQKELANEIYYQKFLQFTAFAQWQKLKKYANRKGVKIIGDIPIFVSHNSADVWINPQEFLLNNHFEMTAVAGVPPDYFNAKGQRWDLPLYNWPKMRENEYAWWVKRLKASLELYDLVRLDHFRGFEAFYQIPAQSPDATHGHWVKGPGYSFFDSMLAQLGKLPFIAEDLGVITKEVDQLRDHYRLPGMRVALIDFIDHGKPDKTDLHAVENHIANCTTYSSTHDFNTVIGWYQKDSNALSRKYFLDKINNRSKKQLVWDFLNHIAASKAVIAMYQMQDVLGLGANARMNFPGTFGNGKNWVWQSPKKRLTAEIQNKLREITIRNKRG